MASEEKIESAVPGISAASGGGAGGKLVPLLTVVNLVATFGMIAIVLLSFQKDKKKPTIEDIAAQTIAEGEHAKGEGEEGKAGAAPGHKAVDFGKMVTLEQFTVNLSTPGSASPKFARVNISIEVTNGDAEAEVGQKMPQVRNAIIDLFNSKRPADLATAEGRDYLKEEIRNALNGFMVSGKIKGVFFTSFALGG